MSGVRSIAVNFKRRARFEEGLTGKSSEPVFAVSFKGEAGEDDQNIDLTGIGPKRPGLVTDFCRFLEATSVSDAHMSRNNKRKYFLRFNEFLDIHESLFGVEVKSISDLNSMIMRDYADWLDGDERVGSKLELVPNSKNNRYNLIKRFIKHCQSSLASRERISKSISFRPAWDVSKAQSSGFNSLSLIHLQTLRAECKRLIASVDETLKASAAVINDPRVILPDLYLASTAPYHYPLVRLKAAAKAFEINGLSGDFRTTMPGLARVFRKPYGSTGDVIRKIFFTTDTILPFLIMIGLPLCFNSIGLVTLQRKNVKYGKGLLGDERIFVIGFKARAGRHQRRSFPVDASDPFSVSSLLETVMKHGEALRSHVEQRYVNCVFIASSAEGTAPGGFFDASNNVKPAINRALSKLLTSLTLPLFTLNDLRIIGADIAALMSEGDVKVMQVLLQHQSAATTLEHYQTMQVARARQEQLAHLMNERERLFRSGGRVDPRGAGKKNGLYRAATPGLDCLDAMNSPIAGQRLGTLCSAYGKCFTCPRAVMFPTATNAARLLQMNERFRQAEMTFNRQRWVVEWDAEFRMLQDFWLLLIPKDVLSDALEVELPPVPLID